MKDAVTTHHEFVGPLLVLVVPQHGVGDGPQRHGRQVEGNAHLEHQALRPADPREAAPEGALGGEPAEPQDEDDDQGDAQRLAEDADCGSEKKVGM